MSIIETFTKYSPSTLCCFIFSGCYAHSGVERRCNIETAFNERCSAMNCKGHTCKAIATKAAH